MDAPFIIIAILFPLFYAFPLFSFCFVKLYFQAK